MRFFAVPSKQVLADEVARLCRPPNADHAALVAEQAGDRARRGVVRTDTRHQSGGRSSQCSSTRGTTAAASARCCWSTWPRAPARPGITELVGEVLPANARDAAGRQRPDRRTPGRRFDDGIVDVGLRHHGRRGGPGRGRRPGPDRRARLAAPAARAAGRSPWSGAGRAPGGIGHETLQAMRRVRLHRSAVRGQPAGHRDRRACRRIRRCARSARAGRPGGRRRAGRAGRRRCSPTPARPASAPRWSSPPASARPAPAAARPRPSWCGWPARTASGWSARTASACSTPTRRSGSPPRFAPALPPAPGGLAVASQSGRGRHRHARPRRPHRLRHLHLRLAGQQGRRQRQRPARVLVRRPGHHGGRALPRVVRQPAQVRPDRPGAGPPQAGPRRRQRPVGGRAARRRLAHRGRRRAGRRGGRAVRPGRRHPRRPPRRAARRRPDAHRPAAARPATGSAIVGNAGGVNVLAADAAEAGRAARAGLRRLRHAGRAARPAGNPLDLGAGAHRRGVRRAAGRRSPAAARSTPCSLVVAATRANDVPRHRWPRSAPVVDRHPTLPVAVVVLGAADPPATVGAAPGAGVRPARAGGARARPRPPGTPPGAASRSVPTGAARCGHRRGPRPSRSALADGGGWQPHDRIAAILLPRTASRSCRRSAAGDAEDAVAVGRIGSATRSCSRRPTPSWCTRATSAASG